MCFLHQSLTSLKIILSIYVRPKFFHLKNMPTRLAMLATVLHPQSCGVVATAHMVLFFANKKKETCDMDAAACHGDDALFPAPAAGGAGE
jgi:hypothetical protein